MILYNVTIKIESEVHEEWLKWMKETHVPDVLKTGFFVECKICRILHQEPDGVTYAFQYFCKSMKDLHMYQVNHAKALQADHTNRYKDRYVAIRTLMEVEDNIMA